MIEKVAKELRKVPPEMRNEFAQALDRVLKVFPAIMGSEIKQAARKAWNTKEPVVRVTLADVPPPVASFRGTGQGDPGDEHRPPEAKRPRWFSEAMALRR